MAGSVGVALHDKLKLKVTDWRASKYESDYPAKEILDDWVKRHPEDEHLGEDTVRKAVDRIDRIMQPDL